MDGEGDLMKMLMQAEPPDASIQRSLEDSPLAQPGAYSQAGLRYGPGHYNAMQQHNVPTMSPQQQSSQFHSVSPSQMIPRSPNDGRMQQDMDLVLQQQQYQAQQPNYGSGSYQGYSSTYQNQRHMSQSHGSNMSPYQGSFSPDTGYGSSTQSLGDFASSNQTMRMPGPASLGLANLSAMSNCQQYYSENYGVNQPVSPVQKQMQASSSFCQPSVMPYSVGSQQPQSFQSNSYPSCAPVSPVQTQMQGFGSGGSFVGRSSAGMQMQPGTASGPGISYQSSNSLYHSQHSAVNTPRRSSTSPGPQDPRVFNLPHETFQKPRPLFPTNQSQFQQQISPQSSCMFVHSGSTLPQSHYQAQHHKGNKKGLGLSKRRASYPGPQNSLVPSPPPKQSPPLSTPSPSPKSSEKPVSVLSRNTQQSFEDQGSALAVRKKEMTLSAVLRDASNAVVNPLDGVSRRTPLSKRLCERSTEEEKDVLCDKPHVSPTKPDAKHVNSEHGLKTEEVLTCIEKADIESQDPNMPKITHEESEEHQNLDLKCKVSSQRHPPMKQSHKEQSKYKQSSESNNDIKLDGDTQSEVSFLNPDSNSISGSHVTTDTNSQPEKEELQEVEELNHTEKPLPDLFDNVLMETHLLDSDGNEVLTEAKKADAYTMDERELIASDNSVMNKGTIAIQQVTQGVNVPVQRSGAIAESLLKEVEKLAKKEIETSSKKQSDVTKEKASDDGLPDYVDGEVSEADFESVPCSISASPAFDESGNQVDLMVSQLDKQSEKSQNKAVTFPKVTGASSEKTVTSSEKARLVNDGSGDTLRDNASRMEDVNSVETLVTISERKESDTPDITDQDPNNTNCNANIVIKGNQAGSKNNDSQISSEEMSTNESLAIVSVAANYKQKTVSELGSKTDPGTSLNTLVEQIPDSEKSNRKPVDERKRNMLSLRCEEHLSLDDDDRLPVGKPSEDLKMQKDSLSQVETSPSPRSESRTLGIQTMQQQTAVRRLAQQQAVPVKATIIAKGKSAQTNQEVVVAKTTSGQVYLIQGNVLVPVQSLSASDSSDKKGSQVIIVNTAKLDVPQAAQIQVKKTEGKQIEKSLSGTERLLSVSSPEKTNVNGSESANEISSDAKDRKASIESKVQRNSGNPQNESKHKRLSNSPKSEIPAKKSKLSLTKETNADTFQSEEKTIQMAGKKYNLILPDLKIPIKQGNTFSPDETISIQTDVLPGKKPGRGRPIGSKDKQKRKSYVHRRCGDRPETKEGVCTDPQEIPTKKKFSKTASAVKEMSVELCPIIKQNREVPTVNKTRPLKKHKVSTASAPLKHISSRPRGGVDGDAWVCSLCGKASNQNFLGDLYGPYKAKITIERSDTLSKDWKSPQKQSLSSRKGSGSDVLVDSEGGDVDLWIHRDCGVWSPGVFMLGRTLDGLEQAVESAAQHKCTKCSEVGATLACFRRGCNRIFHYACARDSGCSFIEEHYTIFCSTHKG